MHETCVPTASASKAATTEESTPPESPQITRPLPTRLADGLDRLAGEIADLPRARALADRLEEVAQDLLPQRRVRHLGMKLQAVDRQPAVLHRGEGQVSVAASGWKSAETCETWSPWLIQT